jgi:hypothetical protein
LDQGVTSARDRLIRVGEILERISSALPILFREVFVKKRFMFAAALRFIS